MLLQTKRLFLRPVQPNDAEAMFVARGDPEVMRYWDFPAQKDAAQVRRIIRNHRGEMGRGETCWWVVALTPRGEAIGECDLSDIDPHHRRAEIGFLFRREAWGRGYAFEAAERAIRFATEDLELQRLSARCHAGNDASRRLLKRLGFEYEGCLKGYVLRDGERRDCLLFGRSLGASPKVNQSAPSSS